MKWSNLKENKCPKCDKDFMLGLKTVPMFGKQLLVHEWRGCDFKIYENRYSQIVNSQINASLEKKLQEESEKLI